MFEFKGKLYDKRTMDRYREKGIVSDKDAETYLKNLPDDSANALYVQMDLHDAEITEDVDSDQDGDKGMT